MSDIERYRDLIIAKVNYLHHKQEMERFAKLFDKNLTVDELRRASFDSKSASAAFKILPSDISLHNANHVQSTLKYNSVEIHLHDSIPCASVALYNIVNEK